MGVIMKLLSIILLFGFSPSVMAAIIPIEDQRNIKYTIYSDFDQNFIAVPGSPFADFDASFPRSDQISGLTSDSMYGTGYGYQSGPYVGTGSGGSSTFDITFEVDTNQDYNLVGTTSIQLMGYTYVRLFADGITLAEYMSNDSSSPAPTSFNDILYLTTDTSYRLTAFGGGALDGGGYYDFQLQAVPVPPAIWLFGSGLIGLIGLVRRKKT